MNDSAHLANEELREGEVQDPMLVLLLSVSDIALPTAPSSAEVEHGA